MAAGRNEDVVVGVIKKYKIYFTYYIVRIIENNKTCQHGLLQFKISMATGKFLPSLSLNLTGFGFPCTRPNLQLGEKVSIPN